MARRRRGRPRVWFSIGPTGRPRVGFSWGCLAPVLALLLVVALAGFFLLRLP